MRQWGKKLLTLALALVMVLPACLPENAQAAGAYGKTTADGVKVRKRASTSEDYWFKLDAGYVCQVLDVVAGTPTWYKVNVEHPDPGSERTYIGYIHGDYFALLTDEEAAQYEAEGKPETVTSQPPATDTATASAPTPTPAPGTSGNTPAYVGATGQITNDGVNFRETEGGNLIAKLNKNTVVEILTIPAAVDTNHWYKVRYDGKEGFIMSTYLKVVSTGDPSATATVPGTIVSKLGYVRLITSSANLRLTPAGTIGAQWTNQGEVLPIAAEPVEYGEVTWYPVDYNGTRYYVREDTVQLQATPGGSGTVVTQAPGTVIGYVKTTDKSVNLRLAPSGAVIEQIKAKGTVLPLLADPTPKNGVKWYYVEAADGSRGYLHGDFVIRCNADGSAYTGTETTAPVTPTQTPATSYGYVITVKSGVNVRTKPTGASQEQVGLGTVLTLTGPVDNTSSTRYSWYPVRTASGVAGVVRGDCVKLCNADGSDLGTVTVSPDASTKPTATPAPTGSVSTFGYVQITKTDVALRKTVGGPILTRLDKSTVWPMTAGKVTKNGVYWYPIEAGGHTGYVRGDCCAQLTASQIASWLAGGGIPEEKPEETVNYVITTMDSVNLRTAATKDATARFNVPLGTVMAFKQAPVGSSNWYKVIYENTEVWVLGTCVREMTAAEYKSWAEANPNNTPQTDVIAGYVKTTDTGVNLRKTAGGTVITRLEKGSVYPYSRTETKSKKTWYYVKTESGYGYLHGDYVIECNKDGSSYTPGGTTTPPPSGQEASYTTLRLGSQGAAVTNLVQELKNQGYYTGDVTSKYTSSVQAAVKGFQSAKGLTVDGIAGAKTQHALFGTVPVGSGDSSNLSMTIYPVEKIDWFTGGIQQLWPKGANYKIYDVKTGIVWWAHRWSGAYHADIEPLTAADTARLCKIYGVSDAQQIADKNMWERRPSLVTIGTRTFACSLDGMPHNPDGDTIPDNNMTGQICLHFTNSKGHESGVVSSTHAQAIEYAYTHAPNGQKK